MTAPSSRTISSPSGTMRSRSGSSALDGLQRVEAHGVLRAVAADEALDRPVRVHEPDAARLHARRSLHAHDRRHHERRALRGELLRPSCELGSDHCGGSGRPCIAAQTRAGVQGMSM